MHNSINMLIFSDAGRKCERGQREYIKSLFIDAVFQGSIYHVRSWSFHFAKRPVLLTPATKSFATGEPTDDGKLLAATLSHIYRMKVPLSVVLDSNVFWIAL